MVCLVKLPPYVCSMEIDDMNEQSFHLVDRKKGSRREKTDSSRHAHSVDANVQKIANWKTARLQKKAEPWP